MSDNEFISYTKKLESTAAAYGYAVRYEGAGQYNKGTGSISSGLHAHIHKIRDNAPEIFRGPNVSREPAMSLAANRTMTDVPSLASNSPLSAPAPSAVKLDPVASASLTNAAGANYESADKISQAADSLLQAVMLMTQGMRSSSSRGSSDLAGSVARGNLAYGIG